MYFKLKFNDFNQYITRPRLEFRTWALNKNHDNELKKKINTFRNNYSPLSFFWIQLINPKEMRKQRKQNCLFLESLLCFGCSVSPLLCFILCYIIIKADYIIYIIILL